MSVVPVILAVGGCWAAYQFGKYRLLCWRQATVNKWLDTAVREKVLLSGEEKEEKVNDFQVIEGEGGKKIDIPSCEKLGINARGKCGSCLRPLWLASRIATGRKCDDNRSTDVSVVYLSKCRCYMHEECFFEETRKAWGVYVMPWQFGFYTEKNLDPAHLWLIAKRLYYGHNETGIQEDFECPRCEIGNEIVCRVPVDIPNAPLEQRLRKQIPSSVPEEELRSLLEKRGGKRWEAPLKDGTERWIELVSRHEPSLLATLCPPTVKRVAEHTSVNKKPRREDEKGIRVLSTSECCDFIFF